jgi:hypothetical protein
MINFVPGLPAPLEKFLSRFDHIFSKPLKRSFRAYVEGLSKKKRIVIAKGSWSEDDSPKVHIYVTNHPSYNNKQVMLK